MVLCARTPRFEPHAHSARHELGSWCATVPRADSLPRTTPVPAATCKGMEARVSRLWALEETRKPKSTHTAPVRALVTHWVWTPAAPPNRQTRSCPAVPLENGSWPHVGAPAAQAAGQSGIWFAELLARSDPGRTGAATPVFSEKWIVRKLGSNSTPRAMAPAVLYRTAYPEAHERVTYTSGRGGLGLAELVVCMLLSPLLVFPPNACQRKTATSPAVSQRSRARHRGNISTPPAP
jgi:hypothetical protein